MVSFIITSFFIITPIIYKTDIVLCDYNDYILSAFSINVPKVLLSFWLPLFIIVLFVAFILKRKETHYINLDSDKKKENHNNVATSLEASLMLRSFGASVTSKDTTVTIQPEPELTGQKVIVPGDISSAAYFIAAGLLVPGSEILIKNVGTNPTRDGILRVCRQMGADIQLLDQKEHCQEPAADILVRYSSLKGTEIHGELIPTLIDELPVIAVMAAFAEGTTVIRDAQELKVKESNRLDIMVRHLQAMGADVTPTEDGMIIRGGTPLHGATLDSHLDHRIAMSFAVAGLAAQGETEITRADCVNISYPRFYEDLQSLQH